MGSKNENEPKTSRVQKNILATSNPEPAANSYR